MILLPIDEDVDVCDIPPATGAGAGAVAATTNQQEACKIYFFKDKFSTFISIWYHNILTRLVVSSQKNYYSLHTSAMPKSLLSNNTCTRGCCGGFDIASTTGVGVEGLPDVAFFYPVKCLSVWIPSLSTK